MTGDPTSGRPAGGSGLLSAIAHRLAGDDVALPVEGRLASFDGASGWLGSEPLTPDSLRGRVVLVDFWTYTCVNWLRTLPDLRVWATKYADHGLTIVGVHTPEFDFEHDRDNVIAMSGVQGVAYPIALDNDYGVWRAFANHFWPAVYIADAEGRIRYHHFGEGEYAMTEMVIQQLLIEAGAADVPRDLVAVDPQGLEVAADWGTLRTPETYVGYGQASGFAQEDVASFGSAAVYELVPLRLNEWALAGTWDVARNAGVAIEPGARIAFRFEARDVNLVMGPTSRGASIPFRCFLDGVPVTTDHGADLGSDGSGVLTEQRTYQLVRQAGSIVERQFEIEFLEAGAAAYCFTFG